jgi:hypothetical protein
MLDRFVRWEKLELGGSEGVGIKTLAGLRTRIVTAVYKWAEQHHVTNCVAHPEDLTHDSQPDSNARIHRQMKQKTLNDPLPQ